MMSDDLKQAVKILILKGAQRVQEDVRERVEKRAQKKAEEQRQAEVLAKKQNEEQRILNIIYCLDDAIVTVLKPGSYDFFIEDRYEERQFENNGYTWTEPVLVDRVRRANVYEKPLLDCKHSYVFRVAIFGDISEEKMIALTDYFRRVEGFEYKKVGIVVSGLAKELVFCATNDRDDFMLINTKLSSRDETKV
jgi:hypothetical protein